MPTPSKGTVFINYRRADSKLVAQLIFNQLLQRFSRDQIFKDFNTISPGDDYTVSIDKALHGCDVLLVLIGQQWLDIRDEAGRRRLDDPADYVRVEIAKALARDIKVIPVMLDGVQMPLPELLPEDIRSLTRRQLVEIDTNSRLEQDVDRLANLIRDILDRLYPGPQPGPVPPQPTPQPVFPAGQKPDNNMVWGILVTLLCCLPLGIVSIISASKVDALYKSGKYDEAQAAAAQAKKWAIWGAGISAAFWVLYLLLKSMGAIQDPSGY